MGLNMFCNSFEGAVFILIEEVDGNKKYPYSVAKRISLIWFQIVIMFGFSLLSLIFIYVYTEEYSKSNNNDIIEKSIND